MTHYPGSLKLFTFKAISSEYCTKNLTLKRQHLPQSTKTAPLEHWKATSHKNKNYDSLLFPTIIPFLSRARYKVLCNPRTEVHRIKI